MAKRTNINEKSPFLRELQIEYLIHELKGPVSVIETGLRRILEKQQNYGPVSSRQEKTLLRTLRNTKKVREMLNDLLEIGRSEAGCFESCRFHPLKAVHEVLWETLEVTVERIFEPVPKTVYSFEQLHRYGIYVSISSKVDAMEMHQDESKFRQIFGNLIKNALFHRKKRINIEMKQKGDCLLIDVNDDGPGVKPEHHETIFGRYKQVNVASTVQRRGHGLGLAGSLIMSRCLGGDIELTRGKRKGATFRLVLPMNLPEIEEP